MNIWAMIPYVYKKELNELKKIGFDKNVLFTKSGMKAADEGAKEAIEQSKY